MNVLAGITGYGVVKECTCRHQWLWGGKRMNVLAGISGYGVVKE